MLFAGIVSVWSVRLAILNRPFERLGSILIGRTVLGVLVEMILIVAVRHPANP